ncbi:MAG: hypothetical protein HRU25_11880 [Psychrobium sp.]|nr:hypothetical protein [Psychrobium sp.]
MVTVKVLALGLGVASLVCAALFWKIDNLKADNKQLKANIVQYESTIESKEAAIQSLQKDLVVKEYLALKQQERVAAIQGNLTKLKKELARLSESDENVKNWANQHVPDAVSGLFNAQSPD